jgi:DNA polymerase
MLDNAMRALGIRQLIGSSAIKKLNAATACIMDDDCIRDSLQYHGTATGLWAGRLLQPHNFPRGTIKGDVDAKVAALMTGDPEYVEALFGPAVETTLSSLRHLIIPRPGRSLVVGDFASIQARIVLALAGQTDKVALIRDGKPGAAYISMAESIYGRDIDKEDDREEYTIGKSTVLGCGFQMGAPKFHLRYCPHKPREFAETVIAAYRDDWAPKVPELWYALGQAAVKTVWDKRPHEAYGCLYQLEDGWLTCRIPSGRKLWYFNPQATRDVMPWDEDDIRMGWTYQATKMGQWRTIHGFGGLMTQNVVSGLARDLLVKAMFDCEANGFPVVLNVHDELVTEPKNGSAELLHQIMIDAPAWACNMGIPVDAETWQGDRYRK